MPTAPTTATKGLVPLRELNKRKGKPRIRHTRMRDFGCCWSDGQIEIRKGLRSKCHLDTLIHELLHHYNPLWTEKKVRQVAKHFTQILWKNRYRRIEKT